MMPPRDPAAPVDDGSTERRLGALVHELEIRAAEIMAIAKAAARPAPSLAERVRDTLAMRRRRDGLLPRELFGEPAWDMLLDLYLAETDGRRISIASACIAAASPVTTTLRHVQALAAAGLVVRMDDPDDRRRDYLELTPKAVAAIEQTYSSSGALPAAIARGMHG